MERLLLVVGRRDQPTDGVVDFCTRLAEAVQAHGLPTEVVVTGGPAAALRLRPRPTDAVLIQYTHLAWSQRGFPVAAVAILRHFRRHSSVTGVVVHDPSGFPGTRVIDRTRRLIQHATMRRLHHVAHLTFTTIHPSVVPWPAEGALLLPAGSNLPAPQSPPQPPAKPPPLNIAIFGVSRGPARQAECTIISRVGAELSRRIPVRFVLFGRGTENLAPLIEVPSPNVTVETHGIVEPQLGSELLRRSHILLFVRGGVSSRRGTISAALAHGLPVVGFRGPETAFPITEAGTVLVDPGDVPALVEAISTVATDPDLQSSLRQRSWACAQQHYAWPVLAARVVRGLQEAAR